MRRYDAPPQGVGSVCDAGGERQAIVVQPVVQPSVQVPLPAAVATGSTSLAARLRLWQPQHRAGRT